MGESGSQRNVQVESHLVDTIYDQLIDTYSNRNFQDDAGKPASSDFFRNLCALTGSKR